MGWINKILRTIPVHKKSQPVEPASLQNLKRYKTGMVCEDAGNYFFLSYLDGTADPKPTEEEQTIPLDNGDRFPPINSSDKACYWSKFPQ